MLPNDLRVNRDAVVSPQVTAIVCTYDRADILSGCLWSLLNQTLANDVYEVLVVDNNSPDNTREVVEHFSKNAANVRYVFEQKQGLSHARNRGYREARADYVCYIDDDGRAEKHYLERLLARFEQLKDNPHLLSIGGPIKSIYQCSVPSWLQDVGKDRLSWGEQARYLTEKECHIGFFGSNMAFRKTFLVRSGGFSAKFGMNGSKIAVGEETELYRRMTGASGAESALFYDPQLICFHLEPSWRASLGYRLRRSFAGGRRNAIEYTMNAELATSGRLHQLLLEGKELWHSSRAVLFKMLRTFGQGTEGLKVVCRQATRTALVAGRCFELAKIALGIGQ